MTPIIITLVIILILLISIVVLFNVIKYKLGRATRKYLGMGLNESAQFIKKGLEEECTIPKSISNVSPVYKPKLLRDFPEMTYEQFIEMSKASLISILDAIESSDSEKLKSVTRSLQAQVNGRIKDNMGRNIVEHFDNIKIHKAGISDYKSSSDNAEATFEISFQCNHFFEPGNSKDKTQLSQLAASVTLAYGKEEAEDSSTTFSHNCPNCGAPIYSVGGRMMRCEYCGTGVTEDIYKSWLTSSFKFIK